ncbi:MAG: single-stranded-DNA-specific exonuclease RecJ [Desulforhopalus sp.]|nr:single-stranded-DNA-specific exonuclease RecJ [Desulforhopalus sp.]
MNNKTQDQVAEKLSIIPSVFIEYLRTRGIVGDEAALKFLYPILADLPRPEVMKNLQAAARLAVEYMIAGKQIIVWGDYDVDGTTGTSLLVNFFRELGTAARWHIPDRLKEGYGLNSKWFTNQSNTSLADDFLLITVDCGISSFQQIELIKKIGGKVIVTDHHSLPEQSIPDCPVLNPSQPSCGFHGEHLAGVGVAFYLAAGIRAELSTHPLLGAAARGLNLKQYLAFVALGTVADLVDLTATNRILVRAGLEALMETPFIGLRELLVSCDISGGHITSEDIGYLIGPRINAAGRLGDSKIVVELLTEDKKKNARRLAQQMTELNLERRRISSNNLETALTLTSKSSLERDKCVIVKGDLHQGVAGIVASRLVDMFGVPAIVFAKNEQPNGQIFFTGSARSVEGVNIVALIAKCSEWIERFGGHEMAAGLTVSGNNIKYFETFFSSLAVEAMKKKKIKPKKQYDILCSAEMIMTKDHLNCIRLLEPFGPGNPQPVFQDPAVKIIDSRAVGRDSEHLQLTIRGRYSNLKGIGFSLGDRLNDIQKKPERNMTYTPTMNRFRGNVNWQVRVIDI